MYNKQKTIELLRHDSNIQKVVSKPKSLIIFTYPIKVIPDKRRFKRMIVCPVGSYKITINQKSVPFYNFNTMKYENKDELQVNIDRENGGIVLGKVVDSSTFYANFKSFHVGMFGRGPICWGNANSDYNKIRKNNDWYWVAKICLDLLTDSNPEGTSEFKVMLYKKLVLGFQYKFAIEQDNKEWIKKLRGLMIEHLIKKRIEVLIEQNQLKIVDYNRYE